MDQRSAKKGSRDYEAVEIELRKICGSSGMAAASEIEGFHRLVNEPEQRRWDPGGEALDLPGLKTFFLDIMPSKPGQAVFLAKAGEEVVGMAAVFTGALGTPPKIGFGVSSAWQGLGIAKALLSEALGHARAAGFRRIVAEVLPHNLRAALLLGRAGFTMTTDGEGAEEGLAVYEKTF